MATLNDITAIADEAQADGTATKLKQSTSTTRKSRQKFSTAAPVKDKKAKDEATAAPTKTEIVLKKLTSAKGVTIQTLMDATGWQAHSVRGFLSGTVKKKLGHELLCETGKGGQRRYRIVEAKTAG